MSMMLALALGAAGATPATTDFEVGGLKFRLAIPAGFCLPEGAAAARAAQVAASDPANVTDVSLIECGVTAPTLPELVVIKTLRQYETTPVEREALVAGIAAALPTVTAPDAQQKLMDQSETNIASATGAKVELKGALRGQGRDAVCAYLGGSVEVAVQDRKVTGLLGACLTVVGTRQFSVYRVSYKPLSDGGAQLLVQARVIALAITPLAAK